MSIEKGLRILDAYVFHEKLDDIGEYNKGRKLYYLNIGANQFIIFSSHQSGKGSITGFDSWISRYYKTSAIGKICAYSNKN